MFETTTRYLAAAIVTRESADDDMAPCARTFSVPIESERKL